MKVNTHEFAQEYTLLECIQCGRCTGSCPVSIKTALNIRSIIYEVLLQDTIEVNGMEVLWDCTNSWACGAMSSTRAKRCRPESAMP